MEIKNKNKIISNLDSKKLGRDALNIVSFGINSINIKKTVKENLPDIRGFENIYVIGFGKSAGVMGEAVEKKLGKKITKGIIIGPTKVKTKIIKSFIGTHPFPSQKNMLASKKILSLVKKATKRDIVICLISGGGSSMFEIPKVPLKKLISLNKKLINSNKSINEINKIRQKYSLVKGGKLAKAILPAACYSLICSDVVSGSIKTIASGPTAVNSQKIHNKIIIDNSLAIKAMGDKAKALGYNIKIISPSLQGDQKKALNKLFSKNGKKPLAIISGGETTLNVNGTGKGGRNQELVLRAINKLPQNSVFLSLASDGIDGISKDAGAIIDSCSFQKAIDKKLNYKSFIHNNDSNTFFKKLGIEINTGKTGVNIMDLQLLLIN